MTTAAPHHRYFSGLSRNTFLLALASLFADISTEMLYPILPVFLTQTLKASGSVVGLIEGVAGATQNIVQGFSGALSDKLQRRKPVALVGYFLAAIGKPLMGAATIWQGVLGGRFLDRLGAGTRSAPRDALIASSVDEANRGRAFGLEGVGDNTGAFLGPLLAVLLLIVWHLDMRADLLSRGHPRPSRLPDGLVGRRAAGSGGGEIEDRYQSEAVSQALLEILVGDGSVRDRQFQQRLSDPADQDIGASLTMTILIYAGFNLVAALISYPAGFLSDQLGRRNILLVSYAIFLATYLGFALTRNIAFIAVLFILYGLYQGIFRSVGKALASDYVPERLRASGIGWYNTTVGLFGLVASLVAGLLWDQVGHAAVFLFGAGFAVVGGIALLALVPANSRRNAAARR